MGPRRSPSLRTVPAGAILFACLLGLILLSGCTSGPEVDQTTEDGVTTFSAQTFEGRWLSEPFHVEGGLFLANWTTDTSAELASLDVTVGPASHTDSLINEDGSNKEGVQRVGSQNSGNPPAGSTYLHLPERDYRLEAWSLASTSWDWDLTIRPAVPASQAAELPIQAAGEGSSEHALGPVYLPEGPLQVVFTTGADAVDDEVQGRWTEEGARECSQHPDGCLIGQVKLWSRGTAEPVWDASPPGRLSDGRISGRATAQVGEGGGIYYPVVSMSGSFAWNVSFERYNASSGSTSQDGSSDSSPYGADLRDFTVRVVNDDEETAIHSVNCHLEDPHEEDDYARLCREEEWNEGSLEAGEAFSWETTVQRYSDDPPWSQFQLHLAVGFDSPAQGPNATYGFGSLQDGATIEVRFTETSVDATCTSGCSLEQS